MIKLVENSNELKKFIYYIKELYENDSKQVFPIFAALKSELKEHVLEKKDYIAILCLREGRVVGRLMFTYESHKMKGIKTCFFSFFDLVDDITVAEELFEYVVAHCRDNNCNYIEGTYAPYDSDVRRGILVEGFDMSPTIFNSYNYEYYNRLLTECGFTKAYDTVAVKANVDDESKRKLDKLSAFVLRRHDVVVNSLDFRNIDRETEAVCTILKEATTELNYIDAPDLDVIRGFVKNMKAFIAPELVKIARERQTGRPIGVSLTVPDYNEILKETGGKLNLIKFFTGRKRIGRARGMLQYVVPDYQKTGLIALLYRETFNEMRKRGMDKFEGSTIMEDNLPSVNAFKISGGEIYKRYRIYGRNI